MVWMVRNQNVKGFFAPFIPRRVTASPMFSFNVNSIPIYTKSNKYRYTNNVNVIRCISIRFERCQKSFHTVTFHHQQNEITQFSGHLVTHKDEALLVSVSKKQNLFHNFFLIPFKTLVCLFITINGQTFGTEPIFHYKLIEVKIYRFKYKTHT